MDKLDVVYCKNCKYFNCRKVNNDSEVYSCKKNSKFFECNQPSLYCNRLCYKVFIPRKKNISKI